MATGVLETPDVVGEETEGGGDNCFACGSGGRREGDKLGSNKTLPLEATLPISSLSTCTSLCLI